MLDGVEVGGIGGNLALLETKPGAFDHARPLMGWTLPECFALLRRRLEAERDPATLRDGVGHPLSMRKDL